MSSLKGGSSVTWTCSSYRNGPNNCCKLQKLPESVEEELEPVGATAAPQSSQQGRWVGAPDWSRLHTSTDVIWFICALISWMLLRIFFWCPASVTPTLRMSLETRQKL